jgi:hypothetical protein
MTRDAQASRTDTQLIIRQRFDTAELVAAHPPVFTDPNKKLVYSLVATSSPPAGEMTYSRWFSLPLPEMVPANEPAFQMREDVFGYEPPPRGSGPVSVEWYLNFADPSLFAYYAGGLLAQDELQVLEHPALGALRQAVERSPDPRMRPFTWEPAGATPVLVRGVERRCALALNPDARAGRPGGLYGNHFAHASAEAVRRALTVLDPPTISNILAMSALPGGRGRYRESEIETIVITAWSGFRAAASEAQLLDASAPVVIHTGHWGTGAFGGNRILMAVLQQIAARLAGIDRLVFHTVDAAGTRDWKEARRIHGTLLPPGETDIELTPLLHRIALMGFLWGQSNGT